MRRDELISDDYAALNATLHRDGSTYGTSGYKWSRLMRLLGTLVSAKTFLDYGCGKQTLAQAVPELSITPYDPAIPGLDSLPAPHDVVACTDVLEHIEPERLASVLSHIAEVTRKAAFFAVSTRPAKRILPDDRNAHLIIQNSQWWTASISRHLDLIHVKHFQGADEVLIVAVPKENPARRAFLKAVFLAMAVSRFPRLRMTRR